MMPTRSAWPVYGLCSTRVRRGLALALVVLQTLAGAVTLKLLPPKEKN